jgi:hypothetical protein
VPSAMRCSTRARSCGSRSSQPGSAWATTHPRRPHRRRPRPSRFASRAAPTRPPVRSVISGPALRATRHRRRAALE